MEPIPIIVAIVLSYLVGSIPFGYLIVRIFKGIDIRKSGSGNIGATNVARVAGWAYGIVVFILDILKGVSGVYIGGFINWVGKIKVIPPMPSPSDYGIKVDVPLAIICGLTAIIGHLFPVWLRFKGGKGVATGLGVFLVLIPIPTIIAFGSWLVIVILLRYISVASMLAAISLPIAYLLMDKPDYKSILFIISCLVPILVIIKHIPNIKRLIKGTEPKVKFKRSNEDKPLNS